MIGRRHTWRFVLGAALATAIAACSEPAPPAGSGAASGAPATSARDAFTIASDLPPLSAAAVASAPRPVETVRATYEFAARHPEVLQYIPCFCGCERAGHKHNTDCFVGGRTADGRVTSWDYHGVG
jgi:hypothetical protein